MFTLYMTPASPQKTRILHMEGKDALHGIQTLCKGCASRDVSPEIAKALKNARVVPDPRISSAPRARPSSSVGSDAALGAVRYLLDLKDHVPYDDKPCFGRRGALSYYGIEEPTSRGARCPPGPLEAHPMQTSRSSGLRICCSTCLDPRGEMRARRCFASYSISRSLWKRLEYVPAKHGLGAVFNPNK